MFLLPEIYNFYFYYSMMDLFFVFTKMTQNGMWQQFSFVRPYNKYWIIKTLFKTKFVNQDLQNQSDIQLLSRCFFNLRKDSKYVKGKYQGEPENGPDISPLRKWFKIENDPPLCWFNLVEI